jgi:hypothetical protein
LTLFALFFFTLFAFGAAARFFVLPPRVDRDRDAALNSACNFAAYAASSSSTLFCFLYFFFGGVFSVSERSDSSSSSASSALRFLPSDGDPALPRGLSSPPLVLFAALPFVRSTVGTAAVPPFCSLLNLSNRASISAVTSS